MPFESGVKGSIKILHRNGFNTLILISFSPVMHKEIKPPQLSPLCACVCFILLGVSIMCSPLILMYVPTFAQSTLYVAKVISPPLIHLSQILN